MPAAVLPPSADQHQKLLDAQKDLLSASFSRANAYNNLILGAGYAGFFAVWAFTRDQLSAPQVLWSALLVSVSLLSFVLFEVYKNLLMSRALLALARAVDDEANFAGRVLEWKREQRAREIQAGRVWASTFWFTLLSGAGGGLILAYAFVRGLLRWYFLW